MSKAPMIKMTSNNESDQLERVKYYPRTNAKGPLRVSGFNSKGQMRRYDLYPGQTTKIEKFLADQLQLKIRRAIASVRKVPDGSGLESRMESEKSPWQVKDGRSGLSEDKDPGVYNEERPGSYEIVFMDREN